MSEIPISISNLNDFIFCPLSIYFHQLGSNLDIMLYQSAKQIDGTIAHQTVDTQTYSSAKNYLQGITVYCEKYNLIGKIDILDLDKRALIERKNFIKNIFDGYIFQLYGQYFSLIEMGYKVEHLFLYSMKDNKKYSVALPNDDIEMKNKFEILIIQMSNFKLEEFKPMNQKKCQQCIYKEMCDRSLA